MLLYLRPGTRTRVVATLALVLILLGVRAGITIYGGEEEAMARITPLSRFATSLSNVGLMVDASSAGAQELVAALEALKTAGFRGTWFVDATTVESCKDVVEEIAAQGHEFGIKGTDQKALDKLTSLEIKDRLLRSRQALAQTGVTPVPFLYPPYARYSDELVAVAFQEGIECVKPAHDASRMRGKEADAASKFALSLRAGDLVLIRVGRKGVDPTVPYLAALKAALNGQGIVAVPLTELVKGVR